MDLIITEEEKKRIKTAELLLITYAALQKDAVITDALTYAVACMKACRMLGGKENETDR